MFPVGVRVERIRLHSNPVRSGAGGRQSYEDLRFLCKEIGHRITGSAQAEMAVEWGRQLMQDYQFDTVYLQEFTAPHWERGTAEAGWIHTTPDGIMIKVKLAALGGSVGTNGLLEAEVVAFDNPEAMNKASEEEIEGKIVFFSQAFDPRGTLHLQCLQRLCQHSLGRRS